MKVIHKHVSKWDAQDFVTELCHPVLGHRLAK